MDRFALALKHVLFETSVAALVAAEPINHKLLSSQGLVVVLVPDDNSYQQSMLQNPRLAFHSPL
jgi:hypothetical protein